MDGWGVVGALLCDCWAVAIVAGVCYVIVGQLLGHCYVIAGQFL